MVQAGKDEPLLASSVWCGLVFSLAVVFTVLNALPPVPVGYRISAQVLATGKRLAALREQLAAHRSSATRDMASEAQLLGVDVLDAQSHAVSPQLEPRKEPLTLVEVRSLWPGRTSTSEVRQWLSGLIETERPTLSRVDSASDERFARWEVEARRHYLKHFRHAHSGEDQSLEQAEQPAGALVSTNDKSPTRLASLSLPSGEKSASPITEGFAQPAAADDSSAAIEAALVREIELATAREAQTAASLHNQIAQVDGVLTLSGSPRVRAYPGRVPTAMVLSVLVLALAGGAIGGWAHHRAQSGGTFYAVDVASSLHVLGLPVLGHVQLRNSLEHAGDVSLARRISNARRWLLRQSQAVSEVVVLFWCLAIAIRMVLDPLWRAMLWDNPLAALGRLFIGLP